MITFLTVIHIIACVGLAGLVLIQDSKGGGVFTSQSSSNSVLGASGATSLAQNMTKIMAVVFAATSITLTIMSSHAEKSVVDNMPVSAATSTTPSSTAAGTPDATATTPTAPAAAPATTAAPAQAPSNEKK